MADVFSLALFERGGRTLMVRRKEDKPPFAGRWLLPGVIVQSEQSAEEALERHTSRELGVKIDEHVFVETLSLDDETTHRRYVANVFRVLRHRGDLRFRAAGDYADARWLSKEQLADAQAPASLRDWLRGDRATAAPAGPVPLPAGGPTPDNRQAWNTIAKAYQERYQLPTDKLVYGPRCPDEAKLNLLGDVSGLHAIVLGCGGGQDCIVLAKQGAQVTGIDLSDEQITFGRRLAEREETQVTLLQGNIEELKGIDDESQDLALSLHALTYVERADLVFAEAYRVLRPDSPFVFSVHHPFDACLEDGPPYGVVKGYWESEQDWQWDFSKARASARMRSWYRPVGEWFSLLAEAGFRVERLLEPPPAEGPATPWDESHSIDKMRQVPANLIVRAVKP